MSISRKIRIASDGAVELVYFDELKGIDLPIRMIRRASHVEPEGNQWIADMAPSSGPKLGPFNTRAEALAAELKWLDDYYLHRPEPEDRGHAEA